MKISLRLVNVQKKIKIICKLLTAIKLKIFRQKSKNTMLYASMGRKGCFSSKYHQDITIKPMIMKTTTNTCKNQKKVEMCEKKVSKPFKPWTFLWKLYLCVIWRFLLANQNYYYLDKEIIFQTYQIYKKKYPKVFKKIRKTRGMEVINQIVRR